MGSPKLPTTANSVNPDAARHLQKAEADLEDAIEGLRAAFVGLAGDPLLRPAVEMVGQDAAAAQRRLRKILLHLPRP